MKCLLQPQSKLEINNRRESGKFTNIQKLKKTFKKSMDQRRNTKKIYKYFEIKENEMTPYEKIWDTLKSVLRGKFTAIKAYIKTEDRFLNQ